MTIPSAPPSDTPPAATPGDVIYCDIHFHIEKSPGGFICGIRGFEEFSGLKTYTPCQSLESEHLFLAFMNLVHTKYNKHNHPVRTITCDAQPQL